MAEKKIKHVVGFEPDPQTDATTQSQSSKVVGFEPDPQTDATTQSQVQPASIPTPEPQQAPTENDPFVKHILGIEAYNPPAPTENDPLVKHVLGIEAYNPPQQVQQPVEQGLQAVKQKTNNAIETIAKDAVQNAPQQYQEHIAGVPFTDPSSVVNQLTDINGNPQQLGQWLQHRIDVIEQQKQRELLMPPAPSVENNFSPKKQIENKYNQQIEELINAGTHILALKIFDKHIKAKGNLTPENTKTILDNITADRDNKINAINKNYNKEISIASGDEEPRLKSIRDTQLSDINKEYQTKINTINNAVANNPVKLGIDYYKALGNQIAIQAEAKLNAGKPLSEEENAILGSKGLDIMRTGAINAGANGHIDFANNAIETASVAEKELKNQSSNYFKSLRTASVANALYQKSNPFYNALFQQPAPSKEDIDKVGKENGIYTKDITSADIPLAAGGIQKALQGFQNTVGGETASLGLLGLGKLAQAGNLGFVNQDVINDYLKNGIENSAAGKLFTGEQPQASQGVYENGQIQYRNLLPEIIGAVGGLGGLMVGGAAVKGPMALESLETAAGLTEKGVSLLGKADHIANATVMGIQGYNSGYENALKIIGDDPNDEGKRQAYSTLSGALNAVIFSIDPQFKIGQDILGKTSAGQSLIKLIKKDGIEGLTKPAIENYAKQALLESGKHVALQPTLAAANEFGKNIADMYFDPNGHHDITDNVKNAAVSAGITMAVPSIWGGIMHPKNQTEMNKNLFYEVGKNPDKYVTELQKLVDNGSISTTEASTAANAIDVMRGITKKADQTNHLDGTPLSEAHKQDLAWLMAQQETLKEKQNSIPEGDDRRTPFEKAQKQAAKTIEDIIEQKGKYAPADNSKINPKPAAPSTTPESGDKTPASAVENPQIPTEFDEELLPEQKLAEVKTNTLIDDAKTPEHIKYIETSIEENEKLNDLQKEKLKSKLDKKKSEIAENIDNNLKPINNDKDNNNKGTQSGSETKENEEHTGIQIERNGDGGNQVQEESGQLINLAEGQPGAEIHLPAEPANKKYSPFAAIDLGSHEGENKTAQLQKEINNTPNDKPFGGDGETFENAVARIQKDIDNTESGKVVIAHSGIMKIVEAAHKYGWDAIDKIREAYNSPDLANEGEIKSLKFGDKEIHFVRHGESKDNSENRIRTKDTPLTEKGKKQAKQIAAKLIEKGLTNPDDIIHSDLERAKQTAEIVKEGLKKNTEPEPISKQEQINKLADKIVKGEKMTPEDVQFHANNKEEVEAELQKRKDAEKKSLIKWNDPEDWDYDEDTDTYTNVGETDNFNIKVHGENTIFEFKDAEKEELQKEHLGDSVSVNLERHNFNRIHIGGIAHPLLNKGYGKEIYNALVENNKIISTSFASASKDAERLWHSLIKSGKYYWANIDDNFFAVSTDKAKIDKFIESKKDNLFKKDVEITRGEPLKNEQEPIKPKVEVTHAEEIQVDNKKVEQQADKPVEGSGGGQENNHWGEPEVAEHAHVFKQVAGNFRKIADELDKKNDGIKKAGIGGSDADILRALAHVLDGTANLHLAIRKVTREVIAHLKKIGASFNENDVRNSIFETANKYLTDGVKEMLYKTKPIVPKQFKSASEYEIGVIKNAADPLKAYDEFIDKIDELASKESISDKDKKKLNDYANYVYMNTVGGYNAAESTSNGENWHHNFHLDQVESMKDNKSLWQETQEDIHGSEIAGLGSEDEKVRLKVQGTTLDNLKNNAERLYTEAQREYAPDNEPIEEWSDKWLKDINNIKIEPIIDDEGNSDHGKERMLVKSIAFHALQNELVNARLDAEAQLQIPKENRIGQKDGAEIQAKINAIDKAQKNVNKEAAFFASAKSAALGSERLRRFMKNETVYDDAEKAVLNTTQQKAKDKLEEDKQRASNTVNEIATPQIISTENNVENNQIILDKIKQDNEALQTELGKNQQELSNVLDEKQKLSDDFNNKAKGYDNKISELNQKIADLSKKEAENKDKIKNLKAELQDNLGLKDKLIEKHQKEIEDLKRKITNLQATNSRKKEQESGNKSTKKENDKRSDERIIEDKKYGNKLKKESGIDSFNDFVEKLKNLRKPC